MNESIDCPIIPNGQDEYFRLRYLPEGLIRARVSRDKLDETSESELDALSWSIGVSSLIPDQLENLESASESCGVETVGMTLSLLPGLSCLSTGSNSRGPSCSLSEDSITRGLSILCDHQRNISCGYLEKTKTTGPILLPSDN